MRENAFQSRVIKSLFYQGAWTFNVHGHRMQAAGIPDLLVVHRKWKGFLELKVGDGRPSAIQCKVMNDIMARGFPCYVLRWDDGVFLESGGNVWQVELNKLIEEIHDVENNQKTV